MAIYRNIHLAFWSDSKIADDFTPEDKYFYLYLLTNPQSNISGCYEVSIKQISLDIGYSKTKVEELIAKFEKVHDVIRYSKDTKEILILNWNKYNWNNSPKFLKALEKEVSKIKNDVFRDYINNKINGIDTVSIPYTYPIDTVSDQDEYPIDTTDTVTDTVYDNVIGYLNDKCGTKYQSKSKSNRSHINTRLQEGYTEADFYTVIDKKCEEWIGTEFEKYLVPETLFGTKFEKYLNQTVNRASPKQNTDDYLLDIIGGSYDTTGSG